jgi:hypothetical protein
MPARQPLYANKNGVTAFFPVGTVTDRPLMTVPVTPAPCGADPVTVSRPCSSSVRLGRKHKECSVTAARLMIVHARLLAGGVTTLTQQPANLRQQPPPVLAPPRTVTGALELVDDGVERLVLLDGEVGDALRAASIRVIAARALAGLFRIALVPALRVLCQDVSPLHARALTLCRSSPAVRALLALRLLSGCRRPRLSRPFRSLWHHGCAGRVVALSA